MSTTCWLLTGIYIGCVITNLSNWAKGVYEARKAFKERAMKAKELTDVLIEAADAGEEVQFRPANDGIEVRVLKRRDGGIDAVSGVESYDLMKPYSGSKDTVMVIVVQRLREQLQETIREHAAETVGELKRLASVYAKAEKMGEEYGWAFDQFDALYDTCTTEQEYEYNEWALKQGWADDADGLVMGPARSE